MLIGDYSSLRRSFAINAYNRDTSPKCDPSDRANESLLESANGSMATAATRRGETPFYEKEHTNSLDSDRPSHGR